VSRSLDSLGQYTCLLNWHVCFYRVTLYTLNWSIHPEDGCRTFLPRYSVYPELIHPPWGWLQDVSTALLCIPWTDPSTVRMAAGRFYRVTLYTLNWSIHPEDGCRTFLRYVRKLDHPRVQTSHHSKKKKRPSLNNTFRENVTTRTYSTYTAQTDWSWYCGRDMFSVRY